MKPITHGISKATEEGSVQNPEQVKQKVNSKTRENMARESNSGIGEKGSSKAQAIE
jgi:hypothetical protein